MLIKPLFVVTLTTLQSASIQFVASSRDQAYSAIIINENCLPILPQNHSTA